MDRNSINWRGYIPAITTPFNQSGDLDLPMLKELLTWLLQERMHGIVVAGTTGEWFSLSKHEKEQLFTTVGKVLKGKMTIIAGCNAYTPSEAIETAKIAEQAGFDGILLTPPPYIKPLEKEIAHFYATVCEHTSMPICVYNWPPGTGVDMSLELLTRLTELENVVAIKNSTSSWEHFLNVFNTLKDRVRVFGVPMNDKGIELVINHGADGMMGAGAILGHLQPDFFNCLWNGDIEAAREIAAKDRRLMDDWFTPELTGKFASAQAIMKAALNLQGLPGGYPRLPILPVEEVYLDDIRKTLKEVGLKTNGSV